MNISSIAKHVRQYTNYLTSQHCRDLYLDRENGNDHQIWLVELGNVIFSINYNNSCAK